MLTYTVTYKLNIDFYSVEVTVVMFRRKLADLKKKNIITDFSFPQDQSITAHCAFCFLKGFIFRRHDKLLNTHKQN